MILAIDDQKGHGIPESLINEVQGLSENQRNVTKGILDIHEAIDLAFPSHGGVSSSESTEIIKGSKIFKLYVVVGMTVGLFLLLAYVLGSFGRGDDNAVRSATPHLFLLSFQILTENVSNPIHCEESLRHSRLANSGEAVAVREAGRHRHRWWTWRDLLRHQLPAVVTTIPDQFFFSSYF
ncbi:hypothetical protein Q3G72_008398 [Acer saccharum]|nr:hypothetical protein Q3G72_008398 [Acer saccharum]